ncbi:MAG: ATP-binding protein [Bacillota bacterium]
MDQIVYFEENVTVRHQMLNDCIIDIKKAIYQKKSPLLFVFGPSGVGKSTFSKMLYEQIIAEQEDKLKSDREWIPIIRVEAKAPESHTFSFKDLYKKFLDQLEDPLVNTEPKGYSKKKSYALRDSLDDLRTAVENALIHRRPLAVVIDEAQHITRVASGYKLELQMDVIKSLANTTNVTFIMIGTYTLVDFFDQSAQLSNRTREYHFHRYRLDQGSDKEKYEFISALATFSTLLPVENKPDLTKHWKHIYLHTIGCIGILKKWLVRALYECYEDKDCLGKTLEFRHLEKTQLRISKINKMITEATEGELKRNEDDVLRQKLSVMLGLDDNMNKNSLRNMDSSENENNKAESKKPKRRVGERKPKRDPVGI